VTVSNTFEPDWALPPGETIKEIFSLKGLDWENASVLLGFEKSFTTGLLSGHSFIGDSEARALQKLLGVSYEFWLRREKNYRSDLKKNRQRSIEKESWVANLPTSDLVKYGWIPKNRGIQNRAQDCLEFFGVYSLDEWYSKYQKQLMTAALKVSESYDYKSESIVTWLRIGSVLSDELACEKWDRNKLWACLPEARSLSRVKSPELFIPQLQELFSHCGVALVIAPTPVRCGASGATFFVSNEKAVILMSFRYLSDDHFWFTLFHEIGHLLLHGKNRLFVEGKLNSDPKEEIEANKFSAQLLIPTKFRQDLKKLCFSNWKQIPRFAKRVGVSNGIVVGQLQYLEILRHNQLNKLKVRYNWSSLTQ
jgi:plasmid maintenance system antidote protein VapI